MIRSILLPIALLATAAPLAAQTAKTGAAATAVPTIAKAKWISDATAEFNRVDANKDGKMSRTEIENFQRAAATARATANNNAVFAALDVDKNGQISKAEFAKLNGGTPKVDATEVLRIDTDKDGQISLAEHKTAMNGTFDQLDADKNGVMTEAEFNAARSPK